MQLRNSKKTSTPPNKKKKAASKRPTQYKAAFETVAAEERVQRQLLLDREAYSNLPLSKLCDKRPELYGAPGSKQRRGVQNRNDYLRKLKATNPEKYWEQYNKAHSGSTLLDAPVSLSSSGDTIDESPPPSPVSKKPTGQTFASPPTTTFASAPVATFESPPEPDKSWGPKKATPLRRNLKMGRSNSVRSPGLKKPDNMDFTSIEEAIEFGKSIACFVAMPAFALPHECAL